MIVKVQIVERRGREKRETISREREMIIVITIILTII